MITATGAATGAAAACDTVKLWSQIEIEPARGAAVFSGKTGSGAVGAKGAEAIASKLVALASQPLVIQGASARVGVSIGIAIGGGECGPRWNTSKHTPSVAPATFPPAGAPSLGASSSVAAASSD